MVGRSLFLTTSCHPMDNASARAQLLEHFLSFFLPEGILDYFELVWAETQSLDSLESMYTILGYLFWGYSFCLFEKTCYLCR